MSDLVNGNYPVKSADWLLRGAPIGSGPSGGRANLSPAQLTVDNAAFTTGQIVYVAIPLLPGDIVNNVACKVGATAGATLTHAFGALYDPNGNLLAQSTDQQLLTITSGVPTYTTGITALTANKVAAFQLGSAATPTPVAIVTAGVYYVAICITGTTLPSLVGTALATAASQGPVLGTAAASLTGNSYAAFQLKPGLSAVAAGNYYVEPCLSQLDASTATGTAPAKMTTNGAPTQSAKVPVVYTF